MERNMHCNFYLINLLSKKKNSLKLVVVFFCEKNTLIYILMQAPPVPSISTLCKIFYQQTFDALNVFVFSTKLRIVFKANLNESQLQNESVGLLETFSVCRFGIGALKSALYF